MWMRPERASRKPSVGKSAESKMDFGDSAIRTEILDAVGESRIELRRINKMEEGAFGIDTGDDSFDGDFLAAAEHYTGDGAVFDADVLDFSVSANFGAGLLCGFGEGAREIAEPAARKCGGTDRMSIRSGAQ